MSGLTQTIKSFFSILNLKLIMAGLLMLVVAIIIIYILIVVIGAVKERQQASSIKLPEIIAPTDTRLGEESKFKEIDSMSIELIDEEDESLVIENKKDNDIKFNSALQISAREFIPLEDDTDYDMPDVVEYSSENVKKQKVINDMNELQKIAVADIQENQDELEEESKLMDYKRDDGVIDESIITGYKDAIK